MKIRILSLALLAMLTAAGARAQNLPGNIWASPQSETTEGRYRSGADDFIRPDSYAGVKFDKWLGLVSFKWDTDNNNFHAAFATAGFAAKASGIYIGAFYTGNFWTGAPVNNYTEKEAAPNGGGTGIYNVYDTVNVAAMSPPVNNAAVLIGLAGMGIRLTYRTNYQSFNKNDIVTGNQLYKNYLAENGYMAPQIAWAMAKDLTKKGIRPYATVDLVFNRDYQRTETNGADGAGNSGAYIDHSKNHFSPSLGLGLGGYTLYNKNGFKLSGDLDYALTFNFYDNEYSYAEDGVYKTGKVRALYKGGSIPFEEKSYLFNSLTPSLSGSWSKEKAGLKFKLNLPLTLTGEEASPMMFEGGSAVPTKDLIHTGTGSSTTAFAFRPDLRLSFQYKIIPDRLTLNTGARIQATAVTVKTIDQTQYNNSGDVSSRAKRHETSFGGAGGFVSRFSVGASFNFTDNIWTEAVTGVSNAYGNEGTVQVFATDGGLFSFGSILVGLKF